MRAPLSIVIPTLNAGNELPATLAALMGGVEAGVIREVIVSDGGSVDQTRAVAEAAGAIWVSGSPSRGGQLRRGVARAEGSYLLLVHADTHLSPDWVSAVSDAIAAGQAGYFYLRFRSPRLAARIVAGWANFRSRFFALPYGDQALLVSTAQLEAVGGVPDQPLMEDVALARALKGRLSALPATAETSFIRYETGGVVRRGARNITLLLRYLWGAHPEHLSARYRS